MVYQHFSLFDTLTAAENVWLGLGKSMSLAQVTQRIREVAGVYGLEVDPLGRCTRSRSARSSGSRSSARC
jgi:simple sugar transport system ATP-binding protein